MLIIPLSYIPPWLNFLLCTADSHKLALSDGVLVISSYQKTRRWGILLEQRKQLLLFGLVCFDWELEIHSTQAYSFVRVPELQNAWKVVGQFFIDCSFSSSSAFSIAHFQKGSSLDVEDGVQKKEGWIFLKLFFESVLPSHGVQKNGLTRRKKPRVWLI